MSLLPPSTNSSYAGSRLAAYGLMFLGAMTIVVGLIHFALPDGGIGIIAGVDLSVGRETIVSMAAWLGLCRSPTASPCSSWGGATGPWFRCSCY